MDPTTINLIALLGTGATIIGVILTIYIRLDTKIDTKVDGVRTHLDAKVDGVKADLETKIDTKVDGVRSDLGGKIDKLDTKIDTKVDGLRSDLDGVARDVVDVKVAVSRIEGHLEARDGFTSAHQARTASRAPAAISDR